MDSLLFLVLKSLGITGSVLLIIFKSLISLCFITCLIRISLNLKNDQKNRPHDPQMSALCAKQRYQDALEISDQWLSNVSNATHDEAYAAYYRHIVYDKVG